MLSTLYNQLLANIKPLSHEKDPVLISLINESIANTHAHSAFSVTPNAIYSIEKPSESLLYRQFDKKLRNKFLLWFGCKQSSLAANLRHGLRMQSAESASTGLMFGKGIYLTDCFSKAANQCQVQASSSTFDSPKFGVVFLAEVALG